MPVTLSMAELAGAADLDLGVTEWRTISQENIDMFADATDDHQWIHVDPERAAAGPFGTTIAHGYMTLALLPSLVSELLAVSDGVMGVNYGIDRLRLTAPVPSGSRVRAKGRVLDAGPKAGGLLYRVDVTVEIEGKERPALVGTVLYLAYGSPDGT
jgi:acyl dehydratase